MIPLLVIRSTTKSFGLPSMRLGMLIGNKEIMKKFISIKLPYETSLLSQKFIEYFLDNSYLIRDYAKELYEGKDFIVNKLRDNGYKVNSGKSNNILVMWNNKKINIDDFVKRCNEKKIYLCKKYEKFIFITCGPKKIMEIILKEFIYMIKLYD